MQFAAWHAKKLTSLLNIDDNHGTVMVRKIEKSAF